MENLLEEALLEEYKLWKKGNDKRIYINKIPELIDIEELIENNDFGIGKGKGLGVSKIARLLKNDGDISIAKLYYDCTYEEFLFQETSSETVNNFIKFFTNELVSRYSPEKEEEEVIEENETYEEEHEKYKKMSFDEMPNDTEFLLKGTNKYLVCYNEIYSGINSMLDDIHKSKIDLNDFFTHYQYVDYITYRFYKLNKSDLIILHESAKEILDKLRTEEEENKNKKIEELLEKAKITGEKQFIDALIMKCDDYMEVYCDFMEVARYAMPNGAIKIEKTAIPID
ncbi:hypothetical protein Q3304_08395 [Clostridioides sp. GD02377]|uniref:hypothetical protein n=1 Tax=unclassified Clostridioides TaxID=2635829 RepID=UPI0038A6B5B3